MKKIMYKAMDVDPTLSKRAKALLRHNCEIDLKKEFPDYDAFYVDLVTVIKNDDWLNGETLMDRPCLSSALKEMDKTQICFGLPDLDSMCLHERRIIDFALLLADCNIQLELSGKPMESGEAFMMEVYKSYAKRLVNEYLLSLTPVEMVSIVAKDKNGIPVVHLASDMGITGDNVCLLTELLQTEKEKDGIVISKANGELDRLDDITCGFLLWAINSISPDYYQNMTEDMLRQNASDSNHRR